MNGSRSFKSSKAVKKIALAFLGLLLMPMCSYAIHYQGPLVVDKNYVKKHGNIITGNYQSTSTNPAILVSNAGSPIFIINSNLQGPTDLISIINSNVTIMNTTGIGTYPLAVGIPKGKFINAVNPTNLIVVNCTISDVSYGVYVSGYNGSSAIGNAIKILENHFSNIDGRPTNSTGGYVANGDFKAHAIQLNTVLSVPGMEIAWNEIINTPYISASGQLIELIDASGTPGSHLLVHDNYIQGAYPADPGVDGYTGGGIIANGTNTDTAATTSAYIDIYNNQIVSTANVGIAIAAGHDVNVYSNRIVSSGYLSNGTFFPMSYANGMYNWNYYQLPPTTFYNDIMQSNVVGLIANGGNNTPTRSDWYFPDQTNVAGNVDWTPYDNQHPTLADEAAEYTYWQAKVNNQQIEVGANPTPVVVPTVNSSSPNMARSVHKK